VAALAANGDGGMVTWPQGAATGDGGMVTWPQGAATGDGGMVTWPSAFDGDLRAGNGNGGRGLPALAQAARATCRLARGCRHS
jgi:hypothetical protein